MNDFKTWSIYSKGLTLGINQCESNATTLKVKKYKPKNVSELCAFVAGIRPSFKSMYDIFEARKRFCYGIPSFDKIVQTEEMPDSFLLYQEQIMASLNYGGIPMSNCYGIIKGISKKKEGIVNSAKKDFISGFTQKIIYEEKCSEEEALRSTYKVWKIIEDASGYGFNASHSLSYAYDSLYCAYLKAYYPYEFYEVLMNEYSEKGKKEKVMKLKQEMKLFGITMGDFKYGEDNRAFTLDKKRKLISNSLLSLKFMNDKTSNSLYEMSKKCNFNNFLELLIYNAENVGIDKTKMTILIQINYFEKFGNPKKLLNIYEYFLKRYKKTHIEKTKIKRIEEIKEYAKTVPCEEFNIGEKAKIEIKRIGYLRYPIDTDDSFFIVSEINRKGTHPILTLINLKTAIGGKIKIKKKVEKENPLKEGDIIKVIKVNNEGRWKTNPKYITKKNKQGFYQDHNDLEPILKCYSKVNFD